MGTAKAGLVDIGYLKATGASHPDGAAEDGRRMPEMELEWKDPREVERDRARPRALLPPGVRGARRPLLPREGPGRGPRRTDEELEQFKVPEQAVSVGFHEAARGVLSHHMVIEEGKIANYQPYPPTPWNANPRDVYGTPGPYEDAVQNTPIFEENGPEKFKGIDIMRAVR